MGRQRRQRHHQHHHQGRRADAGGAGDRGGRRYGHGLGAVRFGGAAAERRASTTASTAWRLQRAHGISRRRRRTTTTTSPRRPVRERTGRSAPTVTRDDSGLRATARLGQRPTFVRPTSPLPRSLDVARAAVRRQRAGALPSRHRARRPVPAADLLRPHQPRRGCPSPRTATRSTSTFSSRRIRWARHQLPSAPAIRVTTGRITAVAPSAFTPETRGPINLFEARSRRTRSRLVRDRLRASAAEVGTQRRTTGLRVPAERPAALDASAVRTRSSLRDARGPHAVPGRNRLHHHEPGAGPTVRRSCGWPNPLVRARKAARLRNRLSGHGRSGRCM